jgi:hypothetical protein
MAGFEIKRRLGAPPSFGQGGAACSERHGALLPVGEIIVALILGDEFAVPTDARMLVLNVVSSSGHT